MTKKHFRMLAKEFHEIQPLFETAEEDAPKRVWLAMVNSVADVCAQVNPNFNRARFLDACRNGLTTKAAS